jgi:pSer/pThr/pTyr-binding forkhead associated (FHA) protein
MEKLFASLRRFLEARERPPADSTSQPTADRPPPIHGSAPVREPAATDVHTADAVSEVRALLAAVAEAPVAAPESDAALPLPPPQPAEQIPLPVPEPAPTPPLAQTPTFSSDPETVDVPSAAPDGALILALATPAATFTIAKSGATLGRGPENPIRLDDLSVSRRHARIAYRQGGYWLSDLGSMGGTWVDGARLNAPRRIAAGEVIDIGHCRLTVSFAAEPVATKNASVPRSEMAGQARRRR